MPLHACEVRIPLSLSDTPMLIFPSPPPQCDLVADFKRPTVQGVLVGCSLTVGVISLIISLANIIIDFPAQVRVSSHHTSCVLWNMRLSLCCLQGCVMMVVRLSLCMSQLFDIAEKEEESLHFTLQAEHATKTWEDKLQVSRAYTITTLTPDPLKALEHSLL